MSISRFSLFLFYAAKHSSRRPSFYPLERCGPSRSILSRGYAKSTSSSHGSAKSTKNGQQKPGGVDPLVSIETKPSRSLGAYIIPGIVLGFAGLVSFLHYNDEKRAVHQGEGCRSDQISVKGPVIGGPFKLIDTDNREVTEKDFQGKWVLLYFGYTSSPDIGPVQVQVMAKAIDTLESKENLKVLPVFVTIDPQRDSPSHLGAYLREFDSRIVGLTGDVGAVRKMAQQYRVYFRKVEEEGNDYLVESTHNMYLINPKMEVAKCFGVKNDAEKLSEAIATELKKATV